MSCVAEQIAINQKQQSVQRKKFVPGIAKARAARPRETVSCIATTHQRFVPTSATKGLQNGFKTQGSESACFLGLSGYHAAVLPRPVTDRSRVLSAQTVLAELGSAIGRFFAKPGIARIMLYLLFFRFAEGQLVRMAQPFLLDSRAQGGLALSTSQVGSVYGICGTVMLLVGGISGGALAARDGLGRWFWWMVAAINLPNVVYWLLAAYQPTRLGWVVASLGVEQLGYGFGFASYVLVSMAAARGGNETVHYAFCTGLWALGLMVPGMLSGWLQQLIGYERFFLWILIATIPSFLVSATLPRAMKA